MKNKTILAEDIEALEEKARYDNSVRNLLANKPILAWIMRFCVGEFKDMEVSDIISCIENDIGISNVRMEPGLSNKKITGDMNENMIPNEGRITYDLIFRVKTPHDMIEVIINVEAQNDYYPGYDLETRGIFYCSRILSAQAGREFSLAKQEYSKIRKVYSIWICVDPPVSQAYTISSYKMNHRIIYGNDDLKVGRYDLQELVIIRLGKDIKKGNDLLKMLSTLLSSTISALEKEKILSDDFKIEMSREMTKEVENMCNLSDGVEKRGRIIGNREGREKAFLELATKLISKGFSDQFISELTEFSPQAVEQLRNELLQSEKTMS